MRRLINLGVGVLIALVALALLFPWVVQAREAANRIKCLHNLKLISVGMENCEHDHEWLLPGTFSKAGLPPEKRLSLWATLQPYLEGGGPYFDYSKTWDDPENLYPRYGKNFERVEPWPRWQGALPVFVCPANPRKQRDDGVGLAHYVGIAGVGLDAPTLPSSDPLAGVFGYGTQGLTRDQIRLKDGLSNTMMIAETAHENGPWMAGGYPTIRGLVPDGLPYLGRDGQFSALHYGSSGFFCNPRIVTNVLFADGSMRSLAAGIDPKVFEALATWAGGERMPEGWDDY
jgi:hypothetical protein